MIMTTEKCEKESKKKIYEYFDGQRNLHLLNMNKFEGT